MVLLSNFNLGKNVMFTGLLKYFSFFFLIWIYHPYNDLGKFPKSIDNGSIHDNRFNLIFNRLLAKQDLQYELPHGNLREKLSDDISIYGKIRKKKPDNFEAYVNDYKRRYRKKKGLSKLDCYCEKKLFDKILYVKGLSEKVHNDKKRFKKFFLKKYGIGLIFFALIPVFGFIFSLLFGVDGWGEGVFPFCKDTGHKNANDVQGNGCSEWHKFQMEEYTKYINPLNSIFSFTMIIIILTFLFYIIIKLIKYEKLKAGKGKMNLMDYCRFCKDVFI
ncbi:hypothetical protein PVIIG_05568 [Plasmodium vivax India VII]|uniref:Variable surface protein Vir10 n=1 Tax=Plasmodium vivax India VII TaxID=1077284 RepID=A0A0J9SK38_PLAVI|nr:hypothetical protein PVIIG_05568 [Plasmodium vivax India VII]